MNDKEIKNGTNGQTDDQIMVQTAPIEFNSEPSSLLPHKYQLKMMASYFKLEERSTNVAQEIRAGASCFLTMSYILLVNPQVLSAIGIPTTDIGKI